MLNQLTFENRLLFDNIFSSPGSDFEHNTMQRQIDDVMGLCCKISDSRQIKAAVQNSAKGAATAGGGAFLGGLLGGPPGIFIGMYWLVCLISCHPQTLT